jgi:hypothetical protein
MPHFSPLAGNIVNQPSRISGGKNMFGTRIWATISILFSLLIFVSPPTFADEAEVECAGIETISQTLGYEVKSLNDNWMEVMTEEGSIYLKEMSSACAYMLMLIFDNAAALADLDFVNKQNVESRFGFLTLQDDNLVFENHILMPNENEFLFKIYFKMFKNEADRINQGLKDILAAHERIEEEYQKLRENVESPTA